MKNTVLITGGLGYVGGRIAEAIVRGSKYDVRISTREVPTELPSWLEKKQIIALDLLSDQELELACSGVQSIIHLAAMNEIDSVKDPEQALLVNGLGTLKLIKAAEKAGVEKFIYFSTAHVYGAPLQGNISEEGIPKPTHPYAITHHVAEDFVLALNKKQSMFGIVLRLSNSLGMPIRPEVNRWTLIANDLCRQAVCSRQLVLQSSGIQIRDFIPLSDVCSAVLYFLKCSTSKCEDGLFNLGGENSLRIIDLAKMIADRCQKLFGYYPSIVKPEIGANETSAELIYNMDKLKSIGFCLEGSIESEIDNTLLFCEKYFSIK